ncbi:KptA family-domain-containing protein [Syncephalis pseudoplumigaleata]|uniref:2'-phosphotransferase n=1 Tax=Syncephalis pseudoplumigaleata TaxID=1712513 RepID=A0A4V1J1D0_9FUNG|nr:KptA family-domain-containing protein [Syncephalis pseudoplumigaleata]|eukprot:RKP24629.1 KptA family-domain-containing protein [Syncephalis pseudoplumigaleata]
MSNPSPPAAGRERSRRPRDSPRVRLSKRLSYLLRHGAVKEGLPLRADGFVPVSSILALPSFQAYGFADIQQIVAECTKQRFTLSAALDAAHDADGEAVWWIRANQGHSLPVADLALEAVADPAELSTLVHGTYHRCWPSIAQEGLRRGTRNHVHLAVGLPGEHGVISGMRTSAQIHIYIDAARAMADGIQFLRSANGVILTAGEGDTGILPPRYFSRVLDKDGRSLWPPSTERE